MRGTQMMETIVDVAGALALIFIIFGGLAELADYLRDQEQALRNRYEQ